MAHLERILIVGGGIAGLTLARALHRQGFQAELVERSPSWQATGAAIQLHANGLRILHSLGLGKEVEQAGVVIRHWLFCDQHGEVLVDLDLEDLWGNVAPCPDIAIDRPRLHQIFVAGAAAVPCRLGIAVASLSQEGKRVKIGFSDGSTHDYDLVVGADGTSSTVRQRLLGPIQLDYSGAMYWRSLVPIRPPDPANFRWLLGDGCSFGITPLPGDGPTNVFGEVWIPRLYDPLPGRIERLRQRFADFRWHAQAALAALSHDEQVLCNPAEEVHLDHWHRGRVVLIGDAAHAGAPTMAQAGIMAMEDAYVLAEVLRSAETVEQALSSYETRRRPRATWVQQQSHTIQESILNIPAFRERGHQLMHDSFAALIPEP
ncbi:MAG TPA: FAD-dependent oxidoreductase [Ktedonosporobacter sp.]|nr:FAD-dependent oxidoreductase [Ktedonosporobacter sp.]